MLQKEWNVHISHQSIENTILGVEIENKASYTNESGYHVFDIQYISINNEWKYRYAILDAKLNVPIADDVLPDQRYKTIEKFLLDNLEDRYVKSITTDGQKEFRQILSKNRLYHQLCIFHTKRGINQKIKRHIRKNKLTGEEKLKLFNEKHLIFDIFNSKTFDEARNKLNNIIEQKESLSKFFKRNILRKIRDFFSNYGLYLKNPNVPRTSNIVENYFSKTMGKSFKKIYRSIKGIKCRIAILSRRYTRRNGKAT